MRKACEELAREVLTALERKDQTAATAESCTGGWLGKFLTDIPGSSRGFLGGVISYTNPVKEALLGVDPEILRTKGAVSPETAEAMACGVRARLRSGFGLSVTGLAGPEGDGSGKPVGLVYVGLAWDGGQTCRELHLTGTREEIRREACRQALLLLLNHLEAPGA